MTLSRLRLLAPEVVQSSAMDCGPAALKCLLEGHGIPVSYGRLREACQTDVDGTSIDTLEEVALQLGLDAEQILVPLDHLLLPGFEALPALAVVLLPNGSTHFVVAWRRHGPFVQIMDPATGRRWTTRKRLLDELYVHQMPVPADDWRAWAGSEAFLDPLCLRLTRLGLAMPKAERLVEQAQADPAWRPLAALDAGTRMVESIVRSGGLRRGREAAGVLEGILEQVRSQEGAAPEPAAEGQSRSTKRTGSTERTGSAERESIPSLYWLARPLDRGPEGEEQVLVRGAVVVHVRGVLEEPARADDVAPTLSPELVAALGSPPARPGRELLRLLGADGLLRPAVLLLAAALSAGLVLLQALLLRGLLDLGRLLAPGAQRGAALAALLVLIVLQFLLRFFLVSGLLGSGRRLDARLRLAMLYKIPLLGDRYLQSRLTSDMAERSHSIHLLRGLPWVGVGLLAAVATMVGTTLGIAWLDPASAPLAALSAVLAAGLPLAAQPLLMERDLRMRTHSGALGRFMLDTLLGLTPVRSHGAEQGIRREHESLLVEWARAGLGLQRSVVVVQTLQLLAGYGLAAWLLARHLAYAGGTDTALLLAYWALSLPELGQELALLARQYPTQRNVALRLLEPLGALEEVEPSVQEGILEAASAPDMRTADERSSLGLGASIRISGVSVRLGGHTILEDLNLEIAAGRHVALLGPSGAGKSTLAGLLLGWHRPATGEVWADGAPLRGLVLDRLRLQTAWVDPAVQLWNRPLRDNLTYAHSVDDKASSDVSPPIEWAIDQAELQGVLEALPEGLDTSLGEGGALVSGGEGQRVRLGRALLRSGVRLAVLDEPFRGLDRDTRQRLLARARTLWQDVTLLCITHDVGEALGFDHVLILEEGRIVEAGHPSELADRRGSRYRAMLDAEAAVREGLWEGAEWRRLRLEEGQILEGES